MRRIDVKVVAPKVFTSGWLGLKAVGDAPLWALLGEAFWADEELVIVAKDDWETVVELAELGVNADR